MIICLNICMVANASQAEDLGIEHTDKVIEIEMTQAEIAEVRKTKRKLPEVSMILCDIM
jgi:hypothetical protein